MGKAPSPAYPKSELIAGVEFDRFRPHKGDGDMWPVTWAADDNLYGGAGDNCGSPMNFWRIEGDPNGGWPGCWAVRLFLVDNLPVDPKKYCRIPPADAKNGVKPAGLLSLDGVLYFAVEAMNYGEDPAFNRQRNVHGWIVTSRDFGRTWDLGATPTDFFEGRLSSCHFVQYGRDCAGARDEFVYAVFPAGDDGKSYWENGDLILLGRVPRQRVLDRAAWEFCTGVSASGEPAWDADGSKAEPVFRYPRMTGENHVAYDAGIGRYLMGNYSFLNAEGEPLPYHGGGGMRSQLTLFEAPEPWGPWSLFHRDDEWGTYGDYQPNFPTKWMSADGRSVGLVSAGTHDDSTFTFQKLTLRLAGD
jgi:hypothetical protein